MSEELQTQDVGGIDLFEIHTSMGPIPVGVADDGVIYLSGHLHPAGIAQAMVLAEREGVPWVPHGAVDALYPVPWLAAAAMGAQDDFRIVAIGQIERYVRGRG